MFDWTTLALLLLAGALSTPAQAASPTFSSSFEPTDPQPTWTNTAEPVLGRHRADRPGPPRQRHGPVVADDGARRERPRRGQGEPRRRLRPDSKWLDFNPTAGSSSSSPSRSTSSDYALTSANDAAERDPRDWTLQGSTRRHRLDHARHPHGRRTFSERFQTKEYSFSTTPPPTSTTGSTSPPTTATSIIQLAELQLSDGDTPPPRPMRHARWSARPARRGYNAKPGAGFTGLAALRYAGATPPRAAATPTTRSSTSTWRSRADTELSYLIYPDFERDDLDYPSTYAAVDLAFTDGTYLSDLGATDQHGAELSPRPGRLQDALREPVEPKRSRIGEVAAGKTIDRILVGYDNPTAPADLRRLDRRPRRSSAGAPRPSRAPLRLGRHHPRHELERRLLARQQHPGDRGAARLQLLDPGDQRERSAGCTSTSATTTRTTCRRCRRSPPATSRARGWATGRPSRSCRPSRPARRTRPQARALAFRPRQRGRAAALLRRHLRERHQDRDRARPTTRRIPVHVPRRLASLIFDNVNNRRRRSPSTGQRRGHRLVRTSAAACPTARRGCSSTPRSTSRSRPAGCCRRRLQP